MAGVESMDAMVKMLNMYFSSMAMCPVKDYSGTKEKLQSLKEKKKEGTKEVR